MAPQTFLQGLDIQATWYSVKVTNQILGFTNASAATIDDPLQQFHTILPSDLGCPVSANAAPATCDAFEKMALAALTDRNATVDPSQLTNVYWINDGSSVGTGFVKVEGVDFSASYDWDMGDLGAWNAGITGTYYLHRYSQTVNGGAIIDYFHNNIQGAGGIPQNGVASIVGGGGNPRLLYRARLGWSNGPYTVTGFMNYQSHYYSTWPVPPNVNNQCLTPGGLPGGNQPCAITGWSNLQPSWLTFDMSFGYDTGDTPANDYLKNVTIQLTIQNLMGIHSPFEYGPSTSTRNVSAYDITKPNTGRILGVTVIKNW